MRHPPHQPSRRSARSARSSGSARSASGDGAARSVHSRRRSELGVAGEELAARWYRRRGYTIIERNWRCRNGEIDLIARRGGTVVFCEVKTRSSRRFGHPAEAVTAAKQRRIRQLALLWLGQGAQGFASMRFDVATVEGGAVEVIPGAF